MTHGWTSKSAKFHYLNPKLSNLPVIIRFFSVSGKPNTMKAVGLKNNKFGDISQLEIQEVGKPKLRKDELLVQVKATALNRADILQREGKYPPPP